MAIVELTDRAFARALGRGRLVPAFQPIVDLGTGRISSFEILARWQTADGEYRGPNDFIPTLQTSGLLSRMMNALMLDACRSASAWDGAFRLTFNASPTQFADPTFASQVAETAAAAGFAQERLQIEITESAIMDDSVDVRQNVATLKAGGIRIILDDFGTGFSSLTRLQAIPFDKIKVDASFVRTMETKRDSRKIVSAVIGLGHSLGMLVVAEGIETAHQHDMLLRLGCDYGQGYFYSRPVFADRAEALLLQRGQAASEAKPFEMSCNRRLAELDAIYDAGDLAICFVDKAARIVTANQAYCDLTGIDAGLDTGRTIQEVFAATDRSIRSVIDDLLLERGPKSRCVTLTTSRGLCVFKLYPVKDENGDVIGISMLLPERQTASPARRFEGAGL